MVEEFQIPNTRWTWENLTGNIHCNQRKCIIRINLPKVKKENIAFEVTKETFCIKSSKDGDNFQDNFSCWIFAQAIEPKEAKVTVKDDILTVAAPLTKSSGVIRVPI